MKAIFLNNGVIHLAESKAVCPHCERDIPFEELEYKYQKQNELTLRMKCKCKRFIGITMDYKGDYVAFELLPKKSKNNLLNLKLQT